jgi:hypothetical protein
VGEAKCSAGRARDLCGMTVQCRVGMGQRGPV